MTHHTTRRLSQVALAVVACCSLAAWSATQIRVMCYQDGNECDVAKDLAKRFEAQNADVKVIIDKVPYKAIVEQLPVQLAAGEGPDIARVTDLGGLSRYYLDLTPYLKDAKVWEANFGETLKWLRPTPSDKGIYGMMTQLTVTGPFVNKTLLFCILPANFCLSIELNLFVKFLLSNGHQFRCK